MYVNNIRRGFSKDSKLLTSVVEGLKQVRRKRLRHLQVRPCSLRILKKLSPPPKGFLLT